VTTHHTVEVTADAVHAALLDFLTARTKATPAPEEDLFGAGLVSSMFVMELVVHLEQTYAIAIVGNDLTMDNFRTVAKMAELVLRLREPAPAHDA
jgi:methoxymalonate biosynthesis acyl carrier protein